MGRWVEKVASTGAGVSRPQELGHPTRLAPSLSPSSSTFCAQVSMAWNLEMSSGPVRCWGDPKVCECAFLSFKAQSLSLSIGSIWSQIVLCGGAILGSVGC